MMRILCPSQTAMTHGQHRRSSVLSLFSGMYMSEHYVLNIVPQVRFQRELF